VPVQSLFHKVLPQVIDIIPNGINIIAISRDNPPPQYAGMCANNKCHLIEWNDIRFTMKESKEILLKGVKKRMTKASFVRLHTQAEGWAAGLVLIAEHIKTQGSDDALQNGFIYEKVFDYFANEIFVKTDKKTQAFLLKTSYLPRMTIPWQKNLPAYANQGAFCRN